MPGTNGFDVIADLGTDMPTVIFVTAYDDFALEAFRHRAFDYLIKPVAAQELKDALDRASRQRRLEERAQLADELRAMIAEARRPTVPARIPVREADGRVTFVELASVSRVDVDGNHIVLHGDGERHRLRLSLSEFEEKIRPDHFVRVHRSAMVNVGHVREIQPWFNGDYVVLLRDGTRVVTGRTYRRTIRALIEL
jgi:two-component system LytT family response regulator